MADLTTSQLGYAKTIVSVGKQRGMSERDIITALVVALTESGLRNYANSNVPESMSIPHDAVGSDHASVGIFQQQVGIWGTASELMNPTTSANKFYDALALVGNRDKTPIPQVAQSVQKSAFADGSNYAKWLGAGTEAWIAVSSGTTGGLNPDKGSTPEIAGQALNNVLDWISSPENWQRIGIFALGALLLIFVLVTLLSETQVAKAAVKVATKL